MTQEDKQLLLKDLCARLPYGVKIYTQENGKNTSFTLTISDLDWIFEDNRIDALYEYDGWKPYLRPMSSITEEERNNLRAYCRTQEGILYDIGVSGAINSPAIIDFLNAHHFDYRCLIEKGLALEALEGMYKENRL